MQCKCHCNSDEAVGRKARRKYKTINPIPEPNAALTMKMWKKTEESKDGEVRLMRMN